MFSFASADLAFFVALDPVHSVQNTTLTFQIEMEIKECPNLKLYTFFRPAFHLVIELAVSAAPSHLLFLLLEERTQLK